MPAVPPPEALAAASAAAGTTLTLVRPVTNRRGAAVFRLSDGDEGRYALKVATDDDDEQRPYSPIASLRREARRMADLPDFCGAAYLADGPLPPQGHWILKRWLDGNLVHRTAIELRDAGDRRGLATLFARVLSTLGRLHERGYVHGDVQPNHMLLAGDDELVILDWSLSQPIGRPDFDYRGAFLHYAAPEVARAMRDDATTIPYGIPQEVFSAGATLFCFYTDWTVTGAGPGTPRLSRDQLYARIVDEGPLAVAATGAAPFPALEAVLARCLAASPAERWPTLQPAADELLRRADETD